MSLLDIICKAVSYEIPKLPDVIPKDWYDFQLQSEELSRKETAQASERPKNAALPALPRLRECHDQEFGSKKRKFGIDGSSGVDFAASPEIRPDSTLAPDDGTTFSYHGVQPPPPPAVVLQWLNWSVTYCPHFQSCNAILLKHDATHPELTLLVFQVLGCRCQAAASSAQSRGRDPQAAMDCVFREPGTYGHCRRGGRYRRGRIERRPAERL
jgi:hypothetical protein